MLAAWLLYPLALAALCLGLGLLVERLAAWRMPGALIVPVGFAALLALARLIADRPQTSSLALPVIGALALAGIAVSRKRLVALRPDPWIAAAALGVAAVYSAPVILSGSPTFAGYLALADTSHQLSLAHLIALHGTDYAALPHGSEQLSMLGYIVTSYPIAAQAALGVTAPLGVIDLAWLYQPFLSFAVIASCLALAALVGPQLDRRWKVAATVFVAGQSALVVGYVLQGSIKETAVLPALIAAAALVAAAIRERRPARSLLALAVIGAAALGSLGPASLPYLAVAAAAVFGVWGIRAVRERAPGQLAWLLGWLALAALLALPVLDTIRTAIDVNTSALDAGGGGGDASANLGNLAAALELRQALGIFMSGDFRYPVSQYQHIQDGLSILAAAAAVLGLVWSLWRGAWGTLLLTAMIVPTSLYLLHRGNPYADGKVLMLASTALLTLAMLGAASLWRGRLRALSVALGGALALGVLYSNALAYRDVSPAPYDRYQELLSLNSRLAGKGPAILNEYDEFAKYFLRDVPVYAQPEYPHGYRVDPVAKLPTLFAPRHRPSLKTPLDVDDLTLRYLESVPYLIVRKSPVASWPPANFRLAWSGRFYDLWRRGATPGVVSHRNLGPDILHPAARVGAPRVRAWAREARRRRGRIAFVRREHAPIVLPSKLAHRWNDFGNYPGALVTAIPAHVAGPVRISRPGRYRVWMEGSFGRRLDVRVDGRRVATTRPGLENPGAYQALATVELAPGTHRLEVSQGIGDRWAPGNSGYRSSLRHIGPIVFDPLANERRTVVQVAPRDWRRLVGIEADWLEIVRP